MRLKSRGRRPRTFHRIALVVVICAAAAWPTRARAQHCHLDLAPRRAAATAGRSRALHLEVATRFTAGAARVTDLTTGMTVTRGYRGGDLALAASWKRVVVSGGLGIYSVDDAGLGIDDLNGAVAVRLTPAHAPVGVRAMASASVPTGDASAGRGMGHVMAAGGVGVAWARGRVRVDGAVVYAQALGDGAAHAAHVHGAELWPLIDPMNARELVTSGAAVADVGSAGLGLRVGADYGQPIDRGVRRAIASFGLELARRRYHVALVVSRPVLGEAFVARGQLTVGYRY